MISGTAGALSAALCTKSAAAAEKLVPVLRRVPEVSGSTCAV